MTITNLILCIYTWVLLLLLFFLPMLWNWIAFKSHM